MDALAELCVSHGIGIAYDCCGQPVDGLGDEGGTLRVLAGVERRLKARGCKRVVTVCPNCHALFKELLGIPAISIFELFEEIGMKSKGAFSPGKLFIPCPDRKSHKLESQLRSSFDLSTVETMRRVSCCGLLPEIARQGSQASERCAKSIIDKASGATVYSYCASCLGQFTRCGHADCQHVISTILEVEERPDTEHAFANRAKRKFDTDVEPRCSQ